MKKIIILKHGGGELANQLWNYLSIYAYGLEIEAEVRNPSFFEYHSFFRFLPKENFITKIRAFFFRVPRRRSHFIVKSARFKYKISSKIITSLNSHCVFSSENNENKATYLPPTKSLPPEFENCNKTYFTGWLFRNPFGLEKFNAELHKVFTPTDKALAQVEKIVNPLRQKYQKIIGVHIRQADYKVFKDGKFLINQERIREIVGEYAKENIIDAGKTVLLVTSDGPIDENLYKNMNIYVSKENSVIDLFLLSKTDVILGSDSSFGAFAAWYGNIPHIIFKNEPIDWDYYSSKKTFFSNKYSTLTQY